MYKKIRKRLTFVCTAITAAILILMILICLFFTEMQILERIRAEFQRDVSSVINYIQSQRILDHIWLSQMEAENHFSLYIESDGKPLLYSKIKNQQTELFFEAKEYAAVQHDGLDIFDGAVTYRDVKTMFSFKASNQQQYYVIASVIGLKEGSFSVICMKSKEEEKNQIRILRGIFFASGVGSILLLFLFAYIFTGHILLPIEVNRKKQTEFVHAASHELKAPLTVVKTSLSLLKEDSGEEKDHYCRMADIECQRISRLLDEMLTLAGADCGSYIMHFVECEIETLLLTSFERFAPAAGREKRILRVLPHENMLPKCFCDSERILQVLGILIDNAISYTKEGDIIELSAKEGEGKVFLMVADNGPGIPKEKRKVIFERFYREDLARSDKQHFGLGLSIAKEIITLHKGKIRVKESKSGGALFEITLNTVQKRD